MQLPFTADQFSAVFRDYNQSVWPAKAVLLALALVATALAATPRRWSGAAISAILGVLWLWTALAYHLAFFAAINPLAYAFAAVAAAGATAFLWQGVVKRRLEFRLSFTGRRRAPRPTGAAAPTRYRRVMTGAPAHRSKELP